MRVKLLSFTSISLSVIFIIIGVLQNQHSTVLEKAIRICLECVGIG